jgi:hypothetical protein
VLNRKKERETTNVHYVKLERERKKIIV